MQNANSASISAAKSRSVNEGMDVIANPRGFSSAIVDIADVILLTDLDYLSINRRPNSLHYTTFGFSSITDLGSSDRPS